MGTGLLDSEKFVGKRVGWKFVFFLGWDCWFGWREWKNWFLGKMLWWMWRNDECPLIERVSWIVWCIPPFYPSTLPLSSLDTITIADNMTDKKK